MYQIGGANFAKIDIYKVTHNRVWQAFYLLELIGLQNCNHFAYGPVS